MHYQKAEVMKKTLGNNDVKNLNELSLNELKKKIKIKAINKIVSDINEGSTAELFIHYRAH